MHSRRDVEFDSDGERCVGWLYEPSAGEQPYPCVVMAHGFGGIKEAKLDAFAERFAAAGYAVLVFDYRHWGASDGTPRNLLHVPRQLADWRAAVDFAWAQSAVDRERIALWGVSFSGGHVISTATSDNRVAAAMALVPFVDGVAQLRAMPPLQSLKLTAAALIDVGRSLLGRSPRYVPIVGQPGSVAALTSPGAQEDYMRMLPTESVAELAWSNEVAARIMLRVPLYRPIRHAADIRCPLLVIVGDNDALVPPGPAIKLAERVPTAELERYPFDHFDPYFDEWFEQVVARQIAFLHKHV